MRILLVLVVLAACSPARCGEAMPAETKVRITNTCTEPGRCENRAHDLLVHRSTKPFVADQRTYPAPYAPSCCTDEACDLPNIPYFADGYEATKTILAVWPADADIALVPSTKLNPSVHECNPPPFGSCYVLSTSDLDADGRRERLVYEHWVNSFILRVETVPNEEAPFIFGCGNV